MLLVGYPNPSQSVLGLISSRVVRHSKAVRSCPLFFFFCQCSLILALNKELRLDENSHQIGPVSFRMMDCDGERVPVRYFYFPAAPSPFRRNCLCKHSTQYLISGREKKQSKTNNFSKFKTRQQQRKNRSSFDVWERPGDFLPPAIMMMW